MHICKEVVMKIMPPILLCFLQMSKVDGGTSVEAELFLRRRLIKWRLTWKKRCYCIHICGKRFSEHLQRPNCGWGYSLVVGKGFLDDSTKKEKTPQSVNPRLSDRWKMDEVFLKMTVIAAKKWVAFAGEYSNEHTDFNSYPAEKEERILLTIKENSVL